MAAADLPPPRGVIPEEEEEVAVGRVDIRSDREGGRGRNDERSAAAVAVVVYITIYLPTYPPIYLPIYLHA